MLGRRVTVQEPAPPRVGGWDPAQLRSLLERLSGPHAMFNLLITGHDHTLRIEEYGVHAGDTFIGHLPYPPALVTGILSASGGQDRGIGRVVFTAEYGVDGGPSKPLVEVVIAPREPDQIAGIRDTLRSSLGRGGRAWLNIKLELITDATAEFQHVADRGYSSSFIAQSMVFGSSVGEARS